MTPPDIARVLVVGAGAMGRQIAAQSALWGCQTVLYDNTPAVIEAAPRLCHDILAALVHQQGGASDQLAAAAARLHTAGRPEEAARDADLLIEAVPEALKIKREVFKLFHPLCPPHTLFATNTSMLLPSMLAVASGRPDRLAAVHFSIEGGIIEIMPHPGTAPETVAALQRFAARLRHLTVVCNREQPGYLVNTMLMALNSSALMLAVNGVASYQDVDRAWMKAIGVDRGPFAMLDVVGLDTAWQITDYGARWTGNAQTKKNADYLKTFVDQGRCGVKSGAGFYTYPNPEYQRPEFLAP